MSGHAATARSGDLEASRGPSTRDDVWINIFDLEPGTCPKCLAPIEPERLPEAELCLDCIVER